MTQQFYRAFEDKHRGSHETIKQRLQVYLPFILPLQGLYDDCRALDVGCGRGEWLETLVENGFNATGVDLDEGMLEACQARHLPAEKADALLYLKAMPSDSLCVLTGFHIVEHIPFEDLKQLVAEANRVLKPGGLLILETPNAENLIVGTQNFYLDPTHEKPIPHMLLEFLVSFSGFSRSKLLRLQENPTLVDSPTVGLMDVIGGASPDYAIVAQKDTETLDMSAFDSAFDAAYGLSLDELARRYEETQASKLGEMEQRLAANQTVTLGEFQQRFDEIQTAKLDDLQSRLVDNQAEKLEEQREILDSTAALLNSRFDHVAREYSAMTHQVDDVKAAVLEFKLDKLKTANASLENANTSLEFANASLVKLLDESSRNAHMWYTEAENRLSQINALKDDAAHKDERIKTLAGEHHSLNEYLTQLKNSTSWRVTSPLRGGAVLGRSVTSSPSQTLKRAVKRVLKGVLNRPGLRKNVKRVLFRIPGLQTRLQALAARLRAETVVTPQTVQYPEPTPSFTPDPSDVPAAPAHLTENAKAIYNRLNSNEQRKDTN
ncbi:O-antigen chain-terminating methyltransferase [Pseudomonas graminis]|uniref:methyltransferase domain-containing protein n=1 Tax=Pseudomonas graminis TaxID=158627 RepID=UPI00105FB309|nr:methyltransferase domain-containing protein [Pseudomonas graminis]TDV47380.1 O-antigen chain-terminating methyltransferase [Pseudomonas graminis]